jgi:hypothetical protein
VREFPSETLGTNGDGRKGETCFCGSTSFVLDSELFFLEGSKLKTRKDSPTITTGSSMSDVNVEGKKDKNIRVKEEG